MGLACAWRPNACGQFVLDYFDRRDGLQLNLVAFLYILCKKFSHRAHLAGSLAVMSVVVRVMREGSDMIAIRKVAI